MDRGCRAGVPPRLVGGRGRERPLPPDLGPRSRRGEGRLRGVRRRGHRPARARPRDARLPLRRVREGRPPSPDEPLCDPRGRDRPDPPGGHPRRPLPGRPPGPARLGRLLLDQADREVLPLRARGPDHPGRVQRRRVRALARRPRSGAPARPGRLQPRRLPLDPRAARLARGPPARGGSPVRGDLRAAADRLGPADRSAGGGGRRDPATDRRPDRWADRRPGEADRRRGRALAAGRPARLAPARCPSGLVGLLPAARAPARGAHRRDGAARRARVRRGRRPGEAVAHPPAARSRRRTTRSPGAPMAGRTRRVGG